MQRPPDRRTPPILFTRGTSEWIVRLNQKHSQLAELRLSSEQVERLDRWAGAEFVYSTLKLEGADIKREQVTQAPAAPDTDVAADERTTLPLLASMRAVASLARAKGSGADLNAEVLLKLHSIPGAGFRRTVGLSSRAVRPAAPEHLAAILESAFRWYSADSFTELNPVEQASIVLLRLIEIQPFEEANERTALVAASLFTLRSGLPPIIIEPEMDSAYRNALDEGARMNTKPMVELIAESMERSIAKMIELAGTKSKAPRRRT